MRFAQRARAVEFPRFASVQRFEFRRVTQEIFCPEFCIPIFIEILVRPTFPPSKFGGNSLSPISLHCTIRPSPDPAHYFPPSAPRHHGAAWPPVTSCNLGIPISSSPTRLLYPESSGNEENGTDNRLHSATDGCSLDGVATSTLVHLLSSTWVVNQQTLAISE